MLASLVVVVGAGSSQTTAATTAVTTAATATAVDLNWYPPRNTSINNLTTAFDDASGTYGFIFNSSETPDGKYGTYNWCNMPHVRKTEYVKAADEYELVYVEVIHRHHKRTPYADNAFPVEPYHWDCPDQGLYYYGQRLPGDAHKAAQVYWQGYTSSINPFTPSGWIGTCQFPQITAEGLDDSWTHGRDLFEVYHDLLGFLPSQLDTKSNQVVFRVTTNVITSQVAGMVISGMWNNNSTNTQNNSTTSTSPSIPLRVQAAAVDSLEPLYPCPASSTLFNSEIRSPTANAAWRSHLEGPAARLFAELDAISGVPSDDEGFHVSFDHYYDNLSARLCHDKPLPCKRKKKIKTPSPNATAEEEEDEEEEEEEEEEDCITQDLADKVFRLGQWEYSQVYRDASASLAASATSFGVWMAELASHLRGVIEEEERGVKEETMMLYFHNVAHDGSMSRLLSVLQVDVMVWPGMGSEVVFELYRDRRAKKRDSTTLAKSSSSSSSSSSSGYFVRVLFGGQVLTSSNPSLGVMDMLPAEILLAYIDGLVGRNASLVPAKCNETIETMP
ncbi:histidine acid phosphatase family protein [Xylariomycetidae sp. FL2044]|nr:histidine acid phosphatase family protein [Xylariomycetidae sp. FL2044]